MNTENKSKIEKMQGDYLQNQSNLAELAVVDSHDLFKGQRQIMILHAGDQYVLSVTKQGKLILTK